jgi:TFIIF-interacting CTD phosphatase-like protein
MTTKKINLYLDLDETLIHSIDIRTRNRTKFIPIEIEKFTSHNFDDAYIVLERPGLQNFLDWLFRHFTVSIWSAASSDYVDFIKKNVVIGDSKERKIERTLHSRHCDKSQKYYGDDHIKKLDMLWEIYQLPNHNANNTILLDDLCSNLRSQPKNCIRIKKFLGSPDDNELEKVKQKLKDVLTHFDKKRKIDKSPIRKRKPSVVTKDN